MDSYRPVPKPERKAKSKEGTPLGILRTEVINRDRTCVASVIDKSHQCRDQWGNPHAPTTLLKLTLEHVHDDRGVRHDLARWCVANCHHANVVERHESANRALYWAYLFGVQAGQGHGG